MTLSTEHVYDSRQDCSREEKTRKREGESLKCVAFQSRDDRSITGFTTSVHGSSAAVAFFFLNHENMTRCCHAGTHHPRFADFNFQHL